tara:strand:+ start:390 stop:1352 length:963 start_codon:yes stop_codon:yes gene_type:complete
MTDDLINHDTHIIQDTKLLSLNSKYASKLNGTQNSRVLFDFVNIIDKSKDHLYMTMAVQSAEIPSSFYNVTIKNNITRVDRDDIAAAFDITMPVGNYNADTYLAKFKELYDAVTPSNVTIALDAVTGIFNLQEALADFTIKSVGSTSYVLWGGEVGTDYVFQKAASGAAASFGFPANFLGVTKIKLSSDNLAGTNVDSSQLKTTTLIDTVSVTATPFGLTIFNSLGRETLMKAKRIEEIDLELRDQDDNLIDFNNAEWCISIIINTHRRVAFSEDRARGIIVNDKYKKRVRAQELEELRGETEKELERMDFSELDDLMNN